MDCSAQPVVVAVRIRPISAKESNDNEVKTVIKQLPNEPQLLIAGGRGFAFDYIFNESAEQSTIYEELIKPRLEYLYQGYNSTIIAYGQTGTGKTYTIGTEPKYTNEASQEGILERVVKDVLSTGLENNASVMLSFMEIYNEVAYDLLGQNSKKLAVQGFTVQNLTCLPVTQYEEARQYLISGASNRHTRSTKMNACSSRSHAIFTVYYRQQRGDLDLESRINLVDLAGSEGVRNTGNKGDALTEATNINKGLLHVGRVISSLSENSEFICYRSSLLTSVLKDSLSQKSYITMIACVSPSSRDIGQTLTTLRFAEQAKKVMARPKISNLIDEYKTSNPEEFEQLSVIMEQIPQTPSAKLKKGKPKLGGIAIPRRPFAPYNWVQSTPSVSTVFKRPNLNLSSESTATSQLNISSASTFMDAVDLSPIIRRHVEEARKVWMNEIPNIVRSELERTLLRETEVMKENLSSLQNMHQMNLHEGHTDLSRTALHNSIRRSLRLSQKNLQHSMSTVHSDKSKFNITEEVNNTVVPNIIKKTNIINTPESSERVSQTNVRRSARLASTLVISSTPESGSCKTSADTVKINSPASIVSPPYLNTGSTLRDDACEKNDFSKRKEEAPALLLKEDIKVKEPKTFQPRRSIRIQSLMERQIISTKDKADYPKRSPQISSKKSQGSLRAVSQKSRKISKQNCTCISSKELISYASNLSPVSRVKKHILDLLNGTLRDLVKLPTIGPKRGFIIYNYRLIRDTPFTNIEDLKEIPGLPSSFYQQFVQANCISFAKDKEVRA